MVPAGLIDIHGHILPDYYTRAVSDAGKAPSISAGFPKWSPDLQIEMMDRLGIAATVNSISQPGVHFGDDAAARALARRCNETFAEMAARHPTRFGSFAALPLPDVAGAVAEIDYALGTLKLDGVGLLASYGETFLSDPKFEPVLEALDHHGATVFVHPNFHPKSRGIQDLAGFLVEFPIDTTRAALGLVFSGAIERYARIRFILAHAGGALPYLSWRISLASMIDQRYAAMTPERVMAQIGRFWFDMAQASGPQVLACLDEISSPDRILFGADWPYCDEKIGQATIDSIKGNAQAARFSGAFSENALALFPRFGRS